MFNGLYDNIVHNDISQNNIVEKGLKILCEKILQSKEIVNGIVKGIGLYICKPVVSVVVSKVVVPVITISAPALQIAGVVSLVGLAFYGVGKLFEWMTC